MVRAWRKFSKVPTVGHFKRQFKLAESGGQALEDESGDTMDAKHEAKLNVLKAMESDGTTLKVCDLPCGQ